MYSYILSFYLKDSAQKSSCFTAFHCRLLDKNFRHILDFMSEQAVKFQTQFCRFGSRCLPITSLLQHVQANTSQSEGRRSMVTEISTVELLYFNPLDEYTSVYSGTPLFQHPEMRTPLYTVEPLYSNPLN